MKTIFFPKSDVPVKVCPHRFGAVATYTEQTDSLFDSSRYGVEFYAHKYGARIGAFINNLTISDLTDLENSQKYGACKFDIYFPTDYWFNPNTGVYEVIPDYYGGTWTQSGIDAFAYDDGGVLKINDVVVSVGTTKSTRTPNIGSQMYTYSNGKYGWSTGGVLGTSKAIEIVKLQEYVINWYKSVFGKFPSSMSYRNGQTAGSPADIIFYLQARNSSTGMWNNTANAPTWYGKDGNGNLIGVPQQEITRDLLSNRANTMRWWDWIDSISGGTTIENSLNGVSNILALTIANKGWVNNFTHWHSTLSTLNESIKLGIYDTYFQTIATAIGSNHVHFCNYGEASEYLLFKECVDNVSAYSSGNSVKVALSLKDPFDGQTINESGFDAKIPYGRINTPISIEVDLSGTFLAGKNIKTNFGKVIDLGNNKVIVQLPFPKSKNEAVIEIELNESIVPDWLSITRPVISDVVVNGEIVTFKTDIPCYSTVFEKTDSNNVTKFGDRYVSEYKTSHEVIIGSTLGKTYHIGVISEVGNTNLYDL